MSRYYGLLFLAAFVLVASCPSVALAARKGPGSLIGVAVIAGVAFAWYLIKLAIRRGKDLKSDVKYHDAMRSGETVQLDDSEKTAINDMISSFLDAACSAAGKPEVDLKRLELAVYDKMMTALTEAGILVSPDLRNNLKISVRRAIAQGAREGEAART